MPFDDTGLARADLTCNLSEIERWEISGWHWEGQWHGNEGRGDLQLLALRFLQWCGWYAQCWLLIWLFEDVYHFFSQMARNLLQASGKKFTPRVHTSADPMDSYDLRYASSTSTSDEASSSLDWESSWFGEQLVWAMRHSLELWQMGTSRYPL